MSTTHVPPEWRTHAEATDYRETPSYDDTVAFARRLAHASPCIDYESFGFSGEGRELPLVIASETGTFTPDAARRIETAWNAAAARPTSLLFGPTVLDLLGRKRA